MSADNHHRHRLRRFAVSEALMGRLSVMLHFLEILLAAVAVVFVVIGTWSVVREIPGFFDKAIEMPIGADFEAILSEILLLVVGIEFGIMLVRRTPESLIEVMFFVVARKMLIETKSFTDILIGVIALAILFTIRRYLFGLPFRASSTDSEPTLDSEPA
jgi:hypothetical protein